MIKLSRGECPEELTDEVRAELTRLYAENKSKDVWNSPKIKEPLKKALLEMSHDKCVYCECMLGIESKDVTIDHFLPKSVNKEKVVEWENLFPACLRCNRCKNAAEDVIINPCKDEPKEYLALCKQNPFRLKGIDEKRVGKKTIDVVDLNNPERVMVPRMVQCNGILERLEEIDEDIKAGYDEKYRSRLMKLMRKCTYGNDYSAVKASNLLRNESYINIKQEIMHNGSWTEEMQLLEEEIRNISFQFV